MVADGSCALDIRTRAAEVVVANNRREEVEVHHVCECKAKHGQPIADVPRIISARLGQGDAR